MGVRTGRHGSIHLHISSIGENHGFNIVKLEGMGAHVPQLLGPVEGLGAFSSSSSSSDCVFNCKH